MQGADDRRVRFCRVSGRALSDVLTAGFAGSEVAPLKELARSLKAGKEKVSVMRKGRRRRRRCLIFETGRAARRERPAVSGDPAQACCSSPLSMDW